VVGILCDGSSRSLELRPAGEPLTFRDPSAKSAESAKLPGSRSGSTHRRPRLHLFFGVVRTAHRVDSLVEEPRDPGGVHLFLVPDPRRFRHHLHHYIVVYPSALVGQCIAHFTARFVLCFLRLLRPVSYSLNRLWNRWCSRWGLQRYRSLGSYDLLYLVQRQTLADKSFTRMR
jgi:hypothetical protein